MCYSCVKHLIIYLYGALGMVKNVLAKLPEWWSFKLSIHQLTLAITSYFVLVLNVPLFLEFYDILSQAEEVKPGFVISIPLFIFAVLLLLFNFISWPYLVKPLFAIIIVLSSMVSYSIYNYGIYIDYGMIENIFETDVAEAGAYLSGYSILWVGGLGAVPAALLVALPLTREALSLLVLRKIIVLVSCILSIVIIFLLYYQDYSSIGRNNPYLKKMIIPTEFIYSTGNYLNKTYFTAPVSHKTIAEDARQSANALSDKPTLLVFVLGETARAQSYQLNGYPVATNQHTAGLAMTSFQNVSACGTATALSVPCMFSILGRDNYDKQQARNQDNALDILQRAGVDILWKENDGGHKGVADRVKTLTVPRDSAHPLCNGTSCYDMVLLDDFEANVQRLTGNRMLVLHLMGSHGPTYYQRYPQQHRAFTPDCPRSDIENCQINQIVNSYDNTILYTDFVLAQTIARLQALQNEYNTALIYISDHGESLGEGGFFLHGIPYLLAPDYQKKVPFITWFSEGFSQQRSIDSQCLSAKAQQGEFSHDNLFHSLLGIMDIQTTVYDQALDVFASCRFGKGE